MRKLVKNDVYFQKSQKTPLLAYEMYQYETHFGFTKLGSNMHPYGTGGFYFCKYGSRTPCKTLNPPTLISCKFCVTEKS